MMFLGGLLWAMVGAFWSRTIEETQDAYTPAWLLLVHMVMGPLCFALKLRPWADD